MVSSDDPFLTMMTMANDEQGIIDLWKLDFFFAVEKVDPKAGRLFVEQVLWSQGEDKNRIEIEMVECDEYLEGGSLEHLEMGNKK